MRYKFRHQELYKGIKIDCKANSKKELMLKIQNRREHIDKASVDEGMRLYDFCRMYLETYKENNVSAGWYKDLCSYADKLVEHIGNKPVGKIKPIEVQAFINSYAGYSNSTIKKVYDFTNQVFKQAIINGATSQSFNLVRPTGKQSVAGRSLTKRETQSLFKVIQGHRGEVFINIMYYCGLRPSEVCALQWKDIDLKRNIITVNKALKKDGSIGTTKSAAGVRQIPVPDVLAGLLKEKYGNPFELVCQQRNGHHTKSSLRKMWESIKALMEKDLGVTVEPLRLYDIRHTYCTNLELQGVPINIASRLMGHSDISITSKIYTHSTEEAIEIARACINENKPIAELVSEVS